MVIYQPTGTILGDEYGLAKKATAIAVKVLSDFGSGSSAYVFHRPVIIIMHVNCHKFAYIEG